MAHPPRLQLETGNTDPRKAGGSWYAKVRPLAVRTVGLRAEAAADTGTEAAAGIAGTVAGTEGVGIVAEPRCKFVVGTPYSAAAGVVVASEGTVVVAVRAIVVDLACLGFVDTDTVVDTEAVVDTVAVVDTDTAVAAADTVDTDSWKDTVGSRFVAVAVAAAGCRAAPVAAGTGPDSSPRDVDTCTVDNRRPP